jgi:hypothetical protein
MEQKSPDFPPDFLHEISWLTTDFSRKIPDFQRRGVDKSQNRPPLETSIFPYQLVTLGVRNFLLSKSERLNVFRSAADLLYHMVIYTSKLLSTIRSFAQPR